MTRFRAAIACALMFVTGETGVRAQSTTTGTYTVALQNYGNYQALGGLFRVGVLVTNNNFSQQLSFDQNTINNLDRYLDPSVLAPLIGGTNALTGAVTEIFDIRGVRGVASYAQNSATLLLSFQKPDGSALLQGNGQPCTIAYRAPAGATRQDTFNQFDADLDNHDSDLSKGIVGCISRGFARSSPVDPIAGNPQSLQATLVRSSLDLASGDSLIESGGGGANSSGDPWIVGATYTGGTSDRFDIDRVDARIARGFRVFTGSRALLKFDLPFSYTRINKADNYSLQLGVGLEVPVIARRWSLEPRVAYGITYSHEAGSIGHIAQASLASRFVIEGIGRGRLVLGDAVGYSQTLGTPGTGYNLNPDVKNWSLRNGLAYELPLKLKVGGRLTSLRASYSYTAFLGTDLYSNHFHEATLSFGIRNREESVRGRRDVIRINVTTVQARGYHTYSGGVGFRF